MKLKNFVKRGLAYGLALSLVISGSGIGTSNTAAAAKKPKLSKSKLTITAGKTVTLSVKNAKKKVKWSTSSKKVVKISAKTGQKNETATLKAVKKGKATVTAKVGKVKLKCKVKVKKPVPNFKSVSVDTYDQKCLVLKLKKKDSSLKVTDLKVATREQSSGSFNKQIVVKKLVAAGKKQYRVYLQKGIGNGNYVQITSGVSKATSQLKLPFYTEKSEVSKILQKGESVNISYTGEFRNNVGAVKLSLAKKSKLPDGLTLDTKNSRIKGIPTTVGNTTVTLQGKDELGRTAKLKVNFGVCDETSLSVSNESYEVKWDQNLADKAAQQAASNATNFDEDKAYLDSYTEDGVDYTMEVTPQGGSGYYTFTLDTPDNTDVRLSTDEISDDTNKTVTKKVARTTLLKIPYSITTGTHTYKVTATDVMDANRTCVSTVTVKIVPYYNLRGVVKSSNGLPISGCDIKLIPAKANSIDDAVNGTAQAETTTNQETDSQSSIGVYDVEVPAGTYTVKVYGDVAYQMAKTIKVGKSDKIADITVPERFYSVTANATYSNKGNKLESKMIYFETVSEQYESNDGLFAVQTNSVGSFSISLPANTYVAYMKDEKGNRKYFGTKITVTNKDLIINSMKASIARYSVEGIVFNGTAVDAKTQYAQKITSGTLDFYNSKGQCVAKAAVKHNGHYKVYLEGGATYVAKMEYAGAMRTFGSVTVEKANLKDSNLTYTVATDTAGALAYAASPLAAESAQNSTGANDVVWSFTPAETAKYSFAVSTAVNSSAKVGLFDANMQNIRYQETGQKDDKEIYQTKITSVSLEANKVYYIKAMPMGTDMQGYDKLPQAQGEVKLVITKDEETTGSSSTTTGGTTTIPNSVYGLLSAQQTINYTTVTIPDTEYSQGYYLYNSYANCDGCDIYVLRGSDAVPDDIDELENTAYTSRHLTVSTDEDVVSLSSIWIPADISGGSITLCAVFKTYNEQTQEYEVSQQQGYLSYSLSPDVTIYTD